MSDLRNLTRDFLRHFIDLYRTHPCLWKTKSKDYLDKNKKNTASQILLEKLKVVQPEATKNTVIQKINSLRGGFKRDLKKVKDSKRSGAGADDIYVPTLWYYPLMQFVADHLLRTFLFFLVFFLCHNNRAHHCNQMQFFRHCFTKIVRTCMLFTAN